MVKQQVVQERWLCIPPRILSSDEVPMTDVSCEFVRRQHSQLLLLWNKICFTYEEPMH